MGYFLSVMKVLALLSLISFAAAVPTCQECNDSIGRLLARITGEESLAEQAAILTGTLCPGAPDPDMCAASLPEQWPIIGGILFPEFLQADAICDDVGICYLFKEITCEDCEAGVSYITGLMRDEGEVAAAVAFPREMHTVARLRILQTVGSSLLPSSQLPWMFWLLLLKKPLLRSARMSMESANLSHITLIK